MEKLTKPFSKYNGADLKNKCQFLRQFCAKPVCSMHCKTSGGAGQWGRFFCVHSTPAGLVLSIVGGRGPRQAVGLEAMGTNNKL